MTGGKKKRKQKTDPVTCGMERRGIGSRAQSERPAERRRDGEPSKEGERKAIKLLWGDTGLAVNGGVVG